MYITTEPPTTPCQELQEVEADARQGISMAVHV